VGACTLGPERSSPLRSALRRYAQPLLSDWGDGERGTETERAQKAICSPSAHSLRVTLHPAQIPVSTAESVSLRRQGGGGGSGRGETGKPGSDPLRDPRPPHGGEKRCERRNAERVPLTGRVESALAWLTGGALDGRQPHSQAAPQAKWSLRIQAEPSYLRRLCRTAPSTSPGRVGACSCRHRGEEESAHTETTVIARYVISSVHRVYAVHCRHPDCGTDRRQLLEVEYVSCNNGGRHVREAGELHCAVVAHAE
jgi:hypothetical protein